MYSTVWCGYCKRLKTMLSGNQTVPTVKFPDGSALTNPSLKDVKAQLGL